MAGKKQGRLDWTAIRQACEQRPKGTTLAMIASAYGISERTLARHRAQWNRQAKVAERQHAEPQSQLQSGPAGSSEAILDHAAMVKRLYQATDQQIRHLEEQLRSGEAAFDEKEARMLGTIARTLDKIMDLAPDPDTANSTHSANQKSGGDAADDQREDAQASLDTLRDELAQRLEHLQRGTDDGLSGQS